MPYTLFHLYLSLGCLTFGAKSIRSSLLATNFTKVIIPAVYHEWKNGPPSWVSNDTLREELGYSTFLYTKQDTSSANYISTNRGCENGVRFGIHAVSSIKRYDLKRCVTYIECSISSSIGILQIYR